MKKFVFVLLVVSVIFFGCAAESDPFGVNTYPKLCSSTGEQLLIKNYDITSNSITLQIQNENPTEITITGFTGNPLPVTWQNTEDATLLRTDSKTFSLKGNFTGRLNEKIEINYTANGKTKTEKVTCTGTVK